MTAKVEVDDATYRALEFAARMANITAGEVVARLVAQASKPSHVPAPGEPDGSANTLKVYADYEGHRTFGLYDRITTRVEITSGPLQGHSYKTPTGAARAVVGHYKPTVANNRNGWLFWTIDDGSGRQLQNVRPS